VIFFINVSSVGIVNPLSHKVVVAYPGSLFEVGGSTNSVENRGQNGDLGAVAR
jgi:hypothetical protein